MSDSPVRINSMARPVNLIDIVNRGEAQPKAEKAGGAEFKQMFSQELARQKDVQFSKHAQQRLFSRGIDLDDATLSKLAGAIDRASVKGSKEALVLGDSAAFLVSIPNRTVITAFDRNHLQEGVVTSIDSAVVI